MKKTLLPKQNQFYGLPRRAVQTFKLALGISLIVALLLSVDLQQLGITFGAARKGMVLVCIFASFLIFDFQALLLGIVARPFAHIPHVKLLSFTLIGRFFSLILPSHVSGDLIKGLYLIPYFSNPAKAYAAMVVQRTLGGLATVFIAVIACLMYLPRQMHFSSNSLFLIVTVAGITALVAWFINRQKVSDLAETLKRTTSNHAIGKRVVMLTSAIYAYRQNKTTLIMTFLLSGISVLSTAGLCMLVAYSLYIPLTFPQALVASSATMLAVLIPLTPGGIGVGEGAFVVTAGLVGVQPEHALAIALFRRVLIYLCSLPGGIIYLFIPVGRSDVNVRGQQ